MEVGVKTKVAKGGNLKTVEIKFSLPSIAQNSSWTSRPIEVQILSPPHHVRKEGSAIGQIRFSAGWRDVPFVTTKAFPPQHRDFGT